MFPEQFRQEQGGGEKLVIEINVARDESIAARAGVIDVTIVNTACASDAQVDKLAHEGLRQLVITEAEKQLLRDQGISCIYAPVIEQAASDRALWNKQDTVRHDREALRTIYEQLLA